VGIPPTNGRPSGGYPAGEPQPRAVPYSSIVELLGEGLVAFDRDGAVLSCNRAARRILGSTEQLPSFCGGACDPPLLLPDGSFMGPAAAPAAVALRTGTAVVDQVVGATRPSGRVRWLSVNAVPVPVGAEAGDLGAVVSFRDITDRKRADAAHEERAIYDALTGLPNQGLLKERVDQAMNRALAGASSVAVVLIGIDRFRVVNDSLGHSAGDALLTRFADRLRVAAAEQTVGRVGGDIFAVVVEDVVAPADAVGWAQRHLRVDGNHRFEVGAFELYVAFSAGIAFSGPGMTAEDLLRNADLAMSRAKQAGGDQVAAFEERDLEAVRERLALETELRHAIATDQIRVFYQPVVRTDDNRVIGAEALARWYHPRRGPVPPDVFLPVLTGLGLSGDLTSYVLRTACAQVAAWKSQGKVPDDFRVSVNLAADDLVNPALADEIRQVLETTGLEPRFLALEVTETGLIRDTEVALECLGAIHRLGVNLALDDFGTGYSSLSYLNIFPVDVVKIDKSFVPGLGADANATALVRGILSLTRALGLAAVAEGIENLTQLEALRQLGCKFAQGFFWSPAVPPEEFPSTFEMPVAPDYEVACPVEHMEGGWTPAGSRPSGSLEWR
jgi:diguanylate cyclase (GGDEF)-like protein